MTDLLLICVTILFFGLCVLYARACEKL